MKRLYVVGLLLLFLVLPFGSSAFASTYSQVISFGDSLSDDGNADGYGFGVWSNGKVWVDYLAESLGVGLLDMAYGGAQSNYHPASGRVPDSSWARGGRQAGVNRDYPDDRYDSRGSRSAVRLAP